MFCGFLAVKNAFIACQATNKNKILTGKADYILIKKKDRIMQAYRGEALLKEYKISLGFSPLGPKTVEGDGKTPEGIYEIVWKNPRSAYHLSLKISYPNEEDLKRARDLGQSPGGDIFIHGIGTGVERGALKSYSEMDWTLGCIAVNNDEIEELFSSVQVGTKVEIIP
ncbi:MAG: L,D-transpeptidase family protein [Holosporales bacterium]|nr:L,D-transpeptidase family protein [Holosporales bacterium]